MCLPQQRIVKLDEPDPGRDELFLVSLVSRVHPHLTFLILAHLRLHHLVFFSSQLRGRVWLHPWTLSVEEAQQRSVRFRVLLEIDEMKR